VNGIIKMRYFSFIFIFFVGGRGSFSLKSCLDTL
jgi:hypothetical protein